LLSIEHPRKANNKMLPRLRICLIVPILVAYINLDPGETCFANRNRTIVIRNMHPLEETTLKQPNPQPRCKCGMTNRVQIGRIINGTNTGKNEFPWIVGLITHSNGIRDNGIRCGGSIISSKTVITAAHCVYGLEKKSKTNN